MQRCFFPTSRSSPSGETHSLMSGNWRGFLYSFHTNSFLFTLSCVETEHSTLCKSQTINEVTYSHKTKHAFTGWGRRKSLVCCLLVQQVLPLPFLLTVMKKCPTFVRMSGKHGTWHSCPYFKKMMNREGPPIIGLISWFDYDIQHFSNYDSLFFCQIAKIIN